MINVMNLKLLEKERQRERLMIPVNIYGPNELVFAI